MRILVVLLAFGLAACAPRLSFANEAGGVVNEGGSLSYDRAYVLASEHCAKYGKVAKIGGRDILAETMRFECVAK